MAATEPRRASGAQGLDGPYVGPRPFARDDAGVFFGRDREIRELLSLVVAHRVVLLYAASGAGKSSLLAAGLVPDLEGEEGFEVLPIARLRGLVDGAVPAGVANVYVVNLLSHWGTADGDGVSVKRALQEREHVVVDGLPAPRALVVDQLEELFTLYPEHWRQRAGYFEQLAAALDADPLLRLVLAIREDYVAQLDPFAPILGGLRTRFRLEPLKPAAALLAVKGPLAGTDRAFAPGVAEGLVEDLRQIRVEAPSGQSVEVEGEFVEPVQLQVACHSLWSALPPAVDVITSDHLQTYGDVDQVLGRYYSSAVAASARAARMRESELRDRVERAFITPAGTRGTAHGAQDSTAGIPVAAIQELENRHVLRAERVRGARWYELTHDRLIEPIRASNRAAREDRDRRRNRRYLRLAAALALLAAAAVGALLLLGSEDEAAVPVAAKGAVNRLQGDLANEKLAQRALVAILRGHTGPVSTAAFSSDAQRVVTASRDGTADVWRADTGQVLLRLPGDGRLTSAAFDPSGDRIVATSEDGTVRLWNWRRLSSLLHDPLAVQEIQRARGLPADGILGPATITALKPEVSTRFAPPAGSASDAAFSRDGKLLATAEDGRARVYKVSDGEPQATLEHGGPITSVAFDPASRLIVTAGADARASIWDWQARRRIRTLQHPGITTASFSSDGRRLVTAGRDGTARIWTLGGRRLVTVRARAALLDAAFSNDGRLLATASANRSAEIWNVPVGTARKATRSVRLSGHSAEVTSVSFSDDGTLVVTSSADRTARVWSPFGTLDVVAPLATPLKPGSEFAIQSGGGARAADGRTYHAAKDWFAPAGAPVRAPVDGRIVEARARKPGSVLGGTLKIEGADGKVWVFRKADPKGVKVGEEVKAGQVVAQVSRAGGGPAYVHIEVWKTLAGGYTYENMLDPMIFFRKLGNR